MISRNTKYDPLCLCCTPFGYDILLLHLRIMLEIWGKIVDNPKVGSRVRIQGYRYWSKRG
jgi:hypothetical protein